MLATDPEVRVDAGFLEARAEPRQPGWAGQPIRLEPCCALRRIGRGGKVGR
jgi:hypothetical protein